MKSGGTRRKGSRQKSAVGRRCAATEQQAPSQPMLLPPEVVTRLVLQHVARDFRCFICYDAINAAVTLPCSHMFCRTCIERANLGKCPLCNQRCNLRGISSLPIVDTVIEGARALAAGVGEDDVMATQLQMTCPLRPAPQPKDEAKPVGASLGRTVADSRRDVVPMASQLVSTMQLMSQGLAVAKSQSGRLGFALGSEEEEEADESDGGDGDDSIPEPEDEKKREGTPENNVGETVSTSASRSGLAALPSNATSTAETTAGSKRGRTEEPAESRTKRRSARHDTPPPCDMTGGDGSCGSSSSSDDEDEGSLAPRGAVCALCRINTHDPSEVAAFVAMLEVKDPNLEDAVRQLDAPTFGAITGNLLGPYKLSATDKRNLAHVRQQHQAAQRRQNDTPSLLHHASSTSSVKSVGGQTKLSPSQLGPPWTGVEVFGEVWIHEMCGLWSSGVGMNHDTGELRNVGPTLSRSIKARCTLCRKSGATLGCTVRSCSRVYHVTCAYLVSKNVCALDPKCYNLRCKEHRLKAA